MNWDKEKESHVQPKGFVNTNFENCVFFDFDPSEVSSHNALFKNCEFHKKSQPIEKVKAGLFMWISEFLFGARVQFGREKGCCK